MTNFQFPIYNREKGQILLLAIVFMAIITTVVSALVGYSGVQVKSHRQALAREQGLNIAEAGVELALWKLNNQPGYNGESGTVYGAGVYNITISSLSGNQKLVKADVFVPNATNPRAKRSVQVTVTTGTTNVSFNYGAQIGDGGLEMENNATIVGNVYSDGKVKGSSNNSITGDVFSAGLDGLIEDVNVVGSTHSHKIKKSDVTGNAYHVELDDTDVIGDAFTDSIKNCEITGNATYNTRTSCTVLGTATTPNPSVPEDPQSIPLPITDEQLDQWEQDAAVGGTIGNQTISGTVSMGPKKIDGDLTVKKNGTLNVTGTIWVTGDITLENDSVTQLDASFGSLSGLIMAAVERDHEKGEITIENNAQVLGSGTAGSYLMLLSQNEEPKTAISVKNNTTTAILYAPYGKVEVKNNAQLKEVTAFKLKLKNNVNLTYEAGLLNANFTSGAAGGWEILNQTWQLLQ